MFQNRKAWISGALIAVLGWIGSGYSMDQIASQPSPLENSPQEKSSSKLTGFYLGGFGGWGSNRFDINQKGIAFYDSNYPVGHALVIDAKGHTNKNGYGLFGMHFGYEWLRKTPSNWSLTPAVELEGFYFSQTKKAHLSNPTDLLDFHEFMDTFPMHTGVVLANGILALTNKYITPYVGAGLGAGIVSIRHAQGIQVEFPETGLNHFNSNPNAFNWNFAAQIKTGLRYSPISHIRLFAEYRFLFFSATTYTFGHTLRTPEFPNHVSTDDWSLRFAGIYNNLFVLGIDFPI